MSELDREASKMRRPWPTRGCCAMVKVLRFVAGQIVPHFSKAVKSFATLGMLCSAITKGTGKFILLLDTVLVDQLKTVVNKPLISFIHKTFRKVASSAEIFCAGQLLTDLLSAFMKLRKLEAHFVKCSEMK